MDYATLITVLVSSFGIPLLTKVGLTLTASQAGVVNTLAVTAVTTVVHWIESHFKAKAAAVTNAANTAQAVADAVAAVPQKTAIAGNSTMGMGGNVLRLVPLFLIVTCAVSALGLSGCATLGKVFTPTSAPYVQVAVDVAVAAAVGTDSATAPAKAAKIKSIAQQLLAADSSSTASLQAIDTAINAKLLTLNLPPADLAAAELLTNTLEAVVQAQLANPTTAAKLGTAQVYIADVLNDVITATSAYGV